MPPSARAVLHARAHALKAELTRVHALAGDPSIDEGLRTRIGGRFDVEVRKCHDELDKVLTDLARGVALDLCYTRFRETAPKRTEVLAELLAFVEGSLARRAGVDAGLCRLADAMLDEMDARGELRWGRFTIVAPADFFAEFTQIIRLRVSDTTIWSLPVAAHELGHFVGVSFEVMRQNGRVREPFREILDRHPRDRRPTLTFLHEQFADVFATFTLGPAFLCTCLFTRFSPDHAAGTAKGDHPSADMRVELALTTLAKLKVAGQRLDPICRMLREWWSEAREGLWKPGENALALEELAEEFLGLLRLSHPTLEFGDSDWQSALMLRDAIRSYDADAPLGGRTIRQALNAAWLCRVEDWARSAFFTERALALCGTLAERRRNLG